MTRPTLIGLVGVKEAGKDTAGKMLAAYGYERRAFGDKLKQEAHDCLNGEDFPRAEPLTVPADIRHILTVYKGHGDAVFEKPINDEIRRLLQWWGTEFRRSFDPDYWVKALAADGLPEFTVITDVRFENEINFVSSRDGAMVKVTRDKPESTNSPAVIETHVSEAIAKSDLFYYDLVLDNNGTLEELQSQIEKAFGSVPVEPVEPPQETHSIDDPKEVPVPEPVGVAPVVEVPVPTSHHSGVAQGEGLVVPTETAP